MDAAACRRGEVIFVKRIKNLITAGIFPARARFSYLSRISMDDEAGGQ